MTAALHRTLLRAVDRLTDDRGDVPGWVLVTVMTAGLVSVLWALADGTLSAMFTNALNSVAGR